VVIDDYGVENKTNYCRIPQKYCVGKKKDNVREEIKILQRKQEKII
jgi:hypothetical protein